MKITRIAVFLIELLTVLTVAAGLSGCESSEDKYAKALELLDEGRIEEAYDIFTGITNYEDSLNLATDIFKQTQLEKLKSAQVGEYISFGSYEQDNDMSTENEPIDWLVLDKDGQNILIISKYALDCLAYDSTNSTEDITWQSSYIRRWLNRTFLPTAFDEIEQLLIEEVTLKDDDGNFYEEDDKVFLLSAMEAGKYFKKDMDRQCIATEYAKAMGVSDTKRNIIGDKNLKTCNWWLRSPGSGYRTALCVFGKGEFGGSGNAVSDDFRAVRPAIWLDLGAFE